MNWLLSLFKKIRAVFISDGQSIKVTDVSGSTVSVTSYKDSVIVQRPPFVITDEWFADLLSLHYDEEIRRKYIPELHQSTLSDYHNFMEMVDFRAWLQPYREEIASWQRMVKHFETGHSAFISQLTPAELSGIGDEDAFINQVNEIAAAVPAVNISLQHLLSFFSEPGYGILAQKTAIKEKIDEIPDFRFTTLPGEKLIKIIGLESRMTRDFLSSIVFLCDKLQQLRYKLEQFCSNPNHAIIAGNAGTGKTHTTAHLINTITENKDYAIFFKPQLFNGDNVVLEDRLLQSLQVPVGYRLHEVLEALNEFAKINKKRCFIFIDALNETTRSHIGFSNIWRNYLQLFINQVAHHDHLYFICTLRTSYIDQVWSSRPASVIELEGFDSMRDIHEACIKYFGYYKINVTNFSTADLSFFRVPLLLDLLCKFINGERSGIKMTTLNISSYLQIFEDYIATLIREVTGKAHLQKPKLVSTGFSNCAKAFLEANEAVISLDDFNDAFDKDDNITTEQSIARLVLEGYLIFIRDMSEKQNEFIKHTHQEVGGYLLAKHLLEKYPAMDSLLGSPEFAAKIIGENERYQHQLRLDILKFLIAGRPGIIQYLNTTDGVKLSWWFLYNGYADASGTGIPNYLLENPISRQLVSDILDISHFQWFNTSHPFNFDFIAGLLNKMDTWELNTHWGLYIYYEVDFIFGFVDDFTENALGTKEKSYLVLCARFIAYVIVTNFRDLRDLATIALIEFGKKFPAELTALVEKFSTFADPYVYERLAACCYGVALQLHNDERFVRHSLGEMARSLYHLQFAENPAAPSYNYVVIDSIKHLVDLAIVKNVFKLEKDEAARLSVYQFKPPFEWIPPTEEQTELIVSSRQTSWPAPIGMDFGIYTIPRLVDRDIVPEKTAIANVYKRIFELGYQHLQNQSSTENIFGQFYWGHSIRGYEGKVDNLGKKYGWMAFFEYAGWLLLHDKLNVFDQNDTNTKFYTRLRDADIDVSLQKRDYKTMQQLFLNDLLQNKNSNPAWYNELRIDDMKPILQHAISGEQYTMLHGRVDYRTDESYTASSYLLTESFFIVKNDQYEKLPGDLSEIVFEWESDVTIPGAKIFHVYFGELYWRDDLFVCDDESVGIPTGRTLYRTKTVDFDDVMHGLNESDEMGKTVTESWPERVSFKAIPSYLDFIWETESKLIPGFSEYLPSVRLGKSLHLTADPVSGNIVDKDLKPAYQSVEYKEVEFVSQEFRYLRTDLLREFMSKNNLALVYQVKQHSYDEDREHFRKLKFFIVE